MGSYKWVISRVTVVMTHIRGLITPLITTGLGVRSSATPLSGIGPRDMFPLGPASPFHTKQKHSLIW